MNLKDLGANSKTLGSVLFLVLAVSAALSLFIYQSLDSHHNSHASLYYLVLLHALVLPMLLLYWRANRGTSTVGFQMRRVHLVAVVVFAGLAIVVGKTSQYGEMIADESSYMFQARIFAAGKLKAESMAFGISNYRSERAEKQVPEIYFEDTIQTPTGWFSKYTPGWPLILAVGYLVKLAWLVNPIFGLLQLALVWHLARPWGVTAQILSILFIATSGYMLIYSVGFMSHASEAVTCLSALCCLLEGSRKKRIGWIVLCFFLVVASTLLRPYTGAVLGLLCTAVGIYELRSQPRLLLKFLLVAGAAGTLAAAGFFFCNWLFTGDALLSPYAVWRGQRGIPDLTFNPLVIAHNIGTIWRWAITDTVRVTFPFMFLFAAFACWKERHRRSELIYLALLFPALVAAHTLQPESSGSFDGERYYFEGFCAIAIVAARGFDLFISTWKVQQESAFAALTLLVGLQAAFLISTIKDIEGVLRPYRQAHKLAVSSPSVPLEFISGNIPPFFQAKTVNWNEADWRNAPTIYLIDPGPDRREQVACRFGRPFYRILQYDVQTNSLSKRDMTVACRP